MQKKLKIFGLGLTGGILVTGLVWLLGRDAQALPPPEDIPEEVARTEIITEARSPLDGSPVTAAEYAEQTAQLQAAPYPPTPPQQFQNLVTILRIRRFLRPFLP
ncbi:MAG: hypothetical protein HC916_15910 [Coleofasciculaceae cyanobacterium SM2_1_6]|nr:hypothetical protein [Coleofasciculaceae cyanobacterium SM2_1_6]